MVVIVDQVMIECALRKEYASPRRRFALLRLCPARRFRAPILDVVVGVAVVVAVVVADNGDVVVDVVVTGAVVVVVCLFVCCLCCSKSPNASDMS